MSARPDLQRRRSRDVGLDALLVERDAEVATLEDRLDDARSGDGSLVLIEGPAGQGKSRLLTIAGDLARARGMLVLGAHASELEREFPFGVAIQLFETRWRACSAKERSRMLTGPAERVVPLLEGRFADGEQVGSDQSYALIHSLFWLACNLAIGDGQESARPLAILVDDLQWVDQPSLRFLAYLAKRIPDLPLALALTVRVGEPAADPHAMTALRSARVCTELRPQPLSNEGVTSIVRSRLLSATDEFCAACARVTGGNPFLLVELTEQVRADGGPTDDAAASRLSELAPASVLSAVLARLGSMQSGVSALACALAVLGDGAPLRRVARLAGLRMSDAARVADVLSEMHLIRAGEPLTFVHPMIAQAVLASMSPLDRGRAHLRAASLLKQESAPDEAVAAHLLPAPAQSDPNAVKLLRAAARTLRQSGDARGAARLLERALGECPEADVYPEVLEELAYAEAAAGLPGALGRLREALASAREPPRRARIALAKAELLYEERDFGRAIEVLTEAAGALPGADQALLDDLEASHLVAATFVPTLAEQTQHRGQALIARSPRPLSPPRRRAAAHLALLGSLRGQKRELITSLVAEAREPTADRAERGSLGASCALLSAALLFTDELEGALEICEQALTAAREDGSPAAYALASYCRAWPLLERGRVLEALADAQVAVDVQPAGWDEYLRSAYGAIACCQIERGELEQAEVSLSSIDGADGENSIRLPFLLETRARLRLAQLRPEQALEDALRAGSLLEWSFPPGVNPGAVSWRSTAALACVAMGEAARGADLAGEELRQAREVGAARVTVRALNALGMSSGAEEGLALLGEAVRVGSAGPPRLEYVRALVTYGAALRRGNHRSAAREPLREALDLAQRGGATALAEQAQQELAATGARPRKAQRFGIESLTPSELRVAELAAQGLTTRKIAEALFVTPKTVEYHLRHVYQKLSIASRAQLAGALRQ